MIYFICGLDYREFKYFEVLQKIRNDNRGIKEYFFDAGLKEEEKFMEKISVNSIFSSQELIVLKRAEKLKNIEKILDYVQKLDIVNKEIVIDYFREDGKLGAKLTKMLNSLKESGKMEVFEYLKKNEEFIRKYVADELKISEKETGQLLEMIGTDPFKVRNEVEKIKVFLGGEEFGIDKVKNIISIEKEFKIYEMTEKILSNSIVEVLEYLRNTKEYMGILYSLYSDLETVYKISTLEKKKENINFYSYNAFKEQFEEIKEIFRSNGRIPNFYAVFKKAEKTKKYSNKNLRKLVYRCWEVEKNIKTGKIDMEIGVESLIIEIAGLYGKK